MSENNPVIVHLKERRRSLVDAYKGDMDDVNVLAQIGQVQMALMAVEAIACEPSGSTKTPTITAVEDDWAT